MEKGKIWDAPEESREEDKDTAPPGEDVRRGGGIQAQCSHENMEQESSPHDVNELHMEPLMLVVREMQSELTVAKLQHNEPRAGGNSAGGRLERTEPGSGGHGHTERNGERHNQDMEDGRLITTETIGKEPDMGDYVGVTKKAVRRPFVCDGSKDSQCVESFLLQRDLRTRLFDHSELEGNVEVVENEDLAEESGDDHPNQYKAGRSYEKSPDSSCLAASCSIADYPYVDFSTNEFIVMCDFAAAEDTQVYAVEASEIAEQTAKLVDENGYSNIIQVQGHRAEELQLPTKVDVLVSEWMGTCLLFEFMLESVLLARDLWLEEDGVMWPSSARVHLVPCSADKEYEARVLFWDSPYGLDFSVLKPIAIQEFFSRPKPDYVLKPEDCLSQPCTLLDVNMKTLSVEDLESMSGEFHFHVDRDGTFHGFTAWFSVQFKNIDNQEQVELDTGPFKKLTHWKHTLFMLDKPLHIYSGDRIAGSAVFKRNPIWRRHLSVTITWTITSSSRTVQGARTDHREMLTRQVGFRTADHLLLTCRGVFLIENTGASG
ncbi:protein arginine N-methyltransferase 2 isoform X5 [Dendrobates tinctorius]|uniref:protein arginine N-methyltransferase 2 isoform X5 n=1 Tax=Dendrobates tinctorius TaxID=92724 RepID=UPI003CC9C580